MAGRDCRLWQFAGFDAGASIARVAQHRMSNNLRKNFGSKRKAAPYGAASIPVVSVS
jgi:hypothetical protein